MVRLGRLAAFAALASFLAGCETNRQEPVDPVTISSCGDLERDVSLPGYVPMVIAVQSDPDGSSASWLWRVPEGAIATDTLAAPNPGIGFQLSLAGSSHGSINSYALLAFRLTNVAELVLIVHDEPATMLRETMTATSTDEIESSPLDAREVALSWPAMQAGDCVGFVFAAISTEAQTLNLTLLPTNIEPMEATELAEIFPHANGTGYAYSAVTRFESGPPNFERQTWIEGSSVIRTDLPKEHLGVPGANLQASTFETRHEESGFSYLGASIGRLGAGGGTHRVEATTHGTVYSDRGYFVDSLENDDLFGRVTYWIMSEGQGYASMAWTFSHAAVDQVMFTIAFQLDLGATLTDLLGVPAAEGFSHDFGLASEIIPWPSDQY